MAIKLEWQRREAAWWSVRRVADALDLSTDQVRRSVLRLAPDGCVRRAGPGRRMKIYAPAILRAYFARQIRPEFEREMRAAVATALAAKVADDADFEIHLNGGAYG